MTTNVQVRMPASICMVKLHAFVQDLGGKIVDEAAPQKGVMHVRLRAGGKSAPAWTIPGSESWSGLGTGSGNGAKAAPSGVDLEMVLRVHRADPKQPDNLTISLNLRPAKVSPLSHRELQEHYDKIVRDLKGYLQSIATSPGDFIPC